MAIRLLLAAIVAGMLSIAPMTSAFACSCMALTTREAFEMADLAFTGTVVGEDVAVPPQPAPPVPGVAQVSYAFDVDAVYKGDVSQPQVVTSTFPDGASCGIGFAAEERWLIFVNLSDGMPWTTSCSANVLLTGNDAEAVLAELPPPVDSPPPVEAGTEGAPLDLPMPLLVGLAAILLVAGVSAWAFRRETSSVR